MALAECNLVDTHRHKRFEGIPINALRNPAVENARQRIICDILLGLRIREGAIDQLDNQMALVGLGVQGIRVIQSSVCVVVGCSSHHGQRKRLGRMRKYTTRPRIGRWRRSRGSSTPWRSVIVRPQRRQIVLLSALSTVSMSSPSLVNSVWRTRRSGMSSGIEISGCLGIKYHPSDQEPITA